MSMPRTNQRGQYGNALVHVGADLSDDTDGTLNWMLLVGGLGALTLMAHEAEARKIGKGTRRKR